MKEKFIAYGLEKDGRYSKEALELIFDELDEQVFSVEESPFDTFEDLMESVFPSLWDCYTEVTNPDEIEMYKKECDSKTYEDGDYRYWDLLDEKGVKSTLFKHCPKYQ